MSDIEISQLLQQMRAMAATAAAQPAPVQETAGAERPDFGALLKQSIEGVKSAQGEASQMAAAFEAGEPGVDLAQVMVSIQKASLSFEAMTQVRNKLLTAYQEIMSMQV